ncbi:MAG: F0F1 ATP synthase subunit B [Cyanobacteria bacterium]|nr:F0F1 ATP synthase subunit B [Cyanobacteria bacterium GSL.Bin21]
MFDWFTFFAQIINFVILVYLLRRFLYRPINKVMDDRQRQLQERWDDAREQQEKAQQEAKKYQDQQAELEAQREELISQAKAEAEAKRQELRQAARAEIQQRREQWQQALQQEKESFYARSRQKLQEETIAICRRVLQDLADADLEDQAIALFLERLKEQSNDENSEIFNFKNAESQEVMIWSGFELSSPQRQRIALALERQNLTESHAIEFQTNPDLIFGIEARFGDYEVRWSVDNYLQNLDRTFSELFTSNVSH